MKILCVGQTGSGTSSLALRLSRCAPEHEFIPTDFSDYPEAKEIPESDGAILVVNLMDGPMPGTRSAIKAMMENKIPALGIALTHNDVFDAQTKYKPNIKELVLYETRELMSEYGYTDEKTPAANLALTTGNDSETAELWAKIRDTLN